MHFSIALDISRITHFLAEIMNPKNSARGKFLTFSMSDTNTDTDTVTYANTDTTDTNTKSTHCTSTSFLNRSNFCQKLSGTIIYY